MISVKKLKRLSKFSDNCIFKKYANAVKYLKIYIKTVWMSHKDFYYNKNNFVNFIRNTEMTIYVKTN